MDVLLYTWPSCSFCQRAKELLDARGVAWRERSLDGNHALRDRLVKRFGRATMPYVLVDGDELGGLAELEQLLADQS